MKLKENEHDKREIIELKRRNCDLECALLGAQIDVDSHKCRYKELEGRVLIVEKEFLEIVSKVKKRSEPVDLVAEKDGFAIAEKRKGTAGSSLGKRPETDVVIIESDDESASELGKALSGENVFENKLRVHKRKYSSSSDDEVDLPTFMPSFKAYTNPKSMNP